MNEIVERGMDNAPHVGISGAFYPRMFVNANEFNAAIERVEKRAETDVNIFHGGIYEGACYGAKIIERAGYKYLYYINGHGDYDSVAFTKA